MTIPASMEQQTLLSISSSQLYKLGKLVFKLDISTNNFLIHCTQLLIRFLKLIRRESLSILLFLATQSSTYRRLFCSQGASKLRAIRVYEIFMLHLIRHQADTYCIVRMRCQAHSFSSKSLSMSRRRRRRSSWLPWSFGLTKRGLGRCLW